MEEEHGQTKRTQKTVSGLYDGWENQGKGLDC